MKTLLSMPLLMFMWGALLFFPVQGSGSELTQESSARLTVAELKHKTAELAYLDELLTSSLLNLVFSGEERWLTRYREYSPQLSGVIGALIIDATEEETDQLHNLDAINRQLLLVEKDAIAAFLRDDRATALAILTDEEYLTLKQRYRHYLDHYVAGLDARLNRINHSPEIELQLTVDELAFIKSTTVRVGVADWPSILTVTDDGFPSGIAAEVLLQIGASTGLRFEYVNGDWGELLGQFTDGRVDLLPHAFYRNQRNSIGDYSSPYLEVRERFFVNKDNIGVRSSRDLVNATIALPSGYATLDKVHKLFPNMSVIETPSIKEAVALVSSGEAEALLMVDTAVHGWLAQNDNIQLRMLDESVFRPESLHLLSTKRHPLLGSILQKGLDRLPLDQLVADQKRLLTLESQSLDQDKVEFVESLWLILGGAIVLMFAVAMVGRSMLRISDQQFAHRFGSRGFKYTVVASLVVISVTLLLATLFVSRYAEQKGRQTLDNNLQTLLTSAHQRLSVWMEFDLDRLAKAAQDRQLTSVVRRLIALYPSASAQQQASLQTQIQLFMTMHFHEPSELASDYFVIDNKRIVIASNKREWIGLTSIIEPEYNEILTSIFSGNASFVPPVSYGSAHTQIMQDSNPAVMFLAVPIVDHQGKVLAVLAKSIDFSGAISVVLSSGSVGNSAETYAIDRSGMLLSDVRFTPQLRRIGMLASNQSAPLRVRIADPGANLLRLYEQNQQPIEADPRWPLTEMAKQISQQRSGANLDGYNDYRGVQVAGRWIWDGELGIGIVAEIDTDEAFDLIRIFQLAIWSILPFSLVMIVGSTMLTLSMGTRATHVLSRSHDELEQRVNARTQDLHDSAQRTKIIIDNASDGIIVVQENGTIQEFSPAAEQIFGYRKEEICGQNVSMLMSEPFHRRYLEQTDGERTALFETLGNRQDGQFINIEVAVGSAVLAGQRIFTGIVRDATARKLAELELTEAKQKAEEATQAKSDFLANMSHEIRTPMNAIIGMSYLALQTDLTRKQADYINKIQNSSEALLGIINDILDFSKIEAGKLEIESVPFSLSDSFDQLVGVILHRAQEKQLEMLLDIDPQLPLNLLGDPLRLGQILLNLANNAVKFTESGEIIIRAMLEHSDQESVTVCFSVQDSGIGMSEERLARLFQPFSQADSSTTRKYGGTGLGLTISKTLSELMGGRIWAESELHRGSTFYFTATFGLCSVDSHKLKVPAESLKGLPILIVDDSQAAREILLTLSQSLGFKPVLAASGEEALAKLNAGQRQGEPFALVVSDWKMPRMDGIELLRQVRAENLKQPKFILVTAYDRDEMLANAGALRIDASVTKPISASTLLDKVMSVMGEGEPESRQFESNKIDLTAAFDIGGAEILLVEDNATNQQVAIELLQLAEINVTTAWNGQEALDSVKQRRFDAVLMDVQMPVMDGYSATQAIRADPNFAELPIIAMTANAMSGDRERCLKAGMNDHIAKPINPQLVYQTLAKWIDPTGKTQQRPRQMAQQQLSSLALPDFNVSEALARFGGSQRAYQRTLEQVLDSESDVIERTKRALAEGKVEEAQRAIHSLKGVAGNIGAEFLVPVATELEQAIATVNEKSSPTNAARLTELMGQCEVLTNQMLASVSSAVTPNRVKKTVSERESQLDIEQIKAALLAIGEQIEMYDSAAVDQVDLLLASNGVAVITTELDRLRKALSEFDFEHSARLLEQLYERLEKETL